MTVSLGARAEQKERTRRAILDAALDLCEQGPLASLSLRQVAKEVGIVPTAFYRHFASIEELGLTLVEESLVSLRGMLRDVRHAGASDPAGPAGPASPDTPGGAGAPGYRDIIDRSVGVLTEHVRGQRRHFAFIARERMAGPAAVREAIARGIELFERELATDLAHLPGTDSWSSEDLRILSDLIVGAMVTTAEKLVSTTPGSPEEARVVETARTQLRMMLVGAMRWESRA